MSFLYKGLQKLKHPIIFKVFNKIAFVDHYDIILPNLFLGNIESSTNVDFLQDNYINSVVNCTENEPFHSYFNNESRSTLRIDVNDSRDPENIQRFYEQIYMAVDFIDVNIKNGNNVLVHCYWGFMRSATIVAAYLIKRHGLTVKEAVDFIKERRPMSLNSMYNFNDLLERYYNEHHAIDKNF